MPNMYENELYHYGILGMKWGVRRFQPYPSDYSGDGKFTRDRSTRKYSLDDDIRIKKGTKFYRISKDKDDRTENKYFTVDPMDRLFYKSRWPSAMRTETGQNRAGEEVYENTYRSTTDLKSPSFNRRVKYASELSLDEDVQNEIAKDALTIAFQDQNRSAGRAAMDYKRARAWVELASIPDNDAYARALKRTFPDESVRQRYTRSLDPLRSSYVEFHDGVKKMLSNFPDNDEGHMRRAHAVLSRLGSSDVIKRKYVDRIIKDNYNMVIDDHGANFPGGKLNAVNAPIFVFGSNEKFKKIRSTKISRLDEESASRKYERLIRNVSSKKLMKYHIPNVSKELKPENYYPHIAKIKGFGKAFPRNTAGVPRGAYT